jgi:two-component system, LytTR family, sensor kinase
VTTYLSIEKIRYGDRLQYRIDFEPQLMNEPIPRFLIQPLIENAIVHATSKLSGTGRIHLDVKHRESFLEFRIEDNGPAFPSTFQPGYGLQSVYDKIRLLGGEDASFQIVDDRKNTPADNKFIAIKIRKRESHYR